MSKSPEKPLHDRPSWIAIAFWIGLISGLIAILTFLSGFQSIPQLLSYLFPPTATSTPAIPQPFRSGTIELLVERNNNFTLGFNFTLGQIAAGNIPKDFTISNCKVSVFNNTFVCDLYGAEISGFGNGQLDAIYAVGQNPDNIILGEQLEIGKTYALLAVDDHAVKFRISSLDITYQDTLVDVVTLVIDYVYKLGSGRTFY